MGPLDVGIATHDSLYAVCRHLLGVVGRGLSQRQPWVNLSPPSGRLGVFRDPLQSQTWDSQPLCQQWGEILAGARQEQPSTCSTPDNGFASF